MYGYSFGAAKADVWHKWDDESMLYPSYMPLGEEHIFRVVPAGSTGQHHTLA